MPQYGHNVTVKPITTRICSLVVHSQNGLGHSQCLSERGHCYYICIIMLFTFPVVLFCFSRHEHGPEDQSNTPRSCISACE